MKDNTMIRSWCLCVLLCFTWYSVGAQTIQWQFMGNPETRRLKKLVFDSQGALLAATDSGMYKSTTSGASWTSINSGLQPPPYPALPGLNDILTASSGLVYAATGGFSPSTGMVFPGKLFVSSDHGTNWEEDSIAIFYVDDVAAPTALCENRNGIPFAGILVYGIYARFASGWTSVYPGSPTAGVGVTTMGRTPSGALLASASKQQQAHTIIRSTDDGSTWERSDWGISGTMLPTSFGFAAGTIYAGYVNTVYQSQDDGVNWTSRGNGLPTSFFIVTSLAVSPDSTTVFASTNMEFGVYRLRSSDTTWQAVNDGLTDLRTIHLVTGPDGRLFVATQSGVFRTVDPVTTVSIPNAKPPTFALEQNYPNPFNPTTNIKFQIPKGELVTLKVFDLLGREVATLVDEEMTPGRYDRVFNADGLASGVYFYQLKAGGSNATRKMLLIR